MKKFTMRKDTIIGLIALALTLAVILLFAFNKLGAGLIIWFLWWVASEFNYFYLAEVE